MLNIHLLAPLSAMDGDIYQMRISQWEIIRDQTLETISKAELQAIANNPRHAQDLWSWACLEGAVNWFDILKTAGFDFDQLETIHELLKSAVAAENTKAIAWALLESPEKAQAVLQQSDLIYSVLRYKAFNISFLDHLKDKGMVFQPEELLFHAIAHQPLSTFDYFLSSDALLSIHSSPFQQALNMEKPFHFKKMFDFFKQSTHWNALETLVFLNNTRFSDELHNWAASQCEAIQIEAVTSQKKHVQPPSTSLKL